MVNVIILKHFEQPKEPGVYARLVCLNGKSKGFAYFLTGNSRAIMGRSETADIPVLDIKSSREHAEIVKVDNNFVVTDLDSQNGIHVNEIEVKQHNLKNNDRIMIGKTVFRFNLVQVREDQPVDIKDAAKKTNKNRSKIIIAAIGALLVFLLLGEDPQSVKKAKKQNGKFKIQEIIDPFRPKKDITKKKKNKAKMKQYFQKGLREFREGNFFRALSEFNQALSWDPNDPLAQFYLRKTKDALDASISEGFTKASRDEESLKFKSALVSYCAIVRLLYNYPKDQRYKDARLGIKKIEEVLGYDEGEVKCLNLELGAKQ